VPFSHSQSANPPSPLPERVRDKFTKGGSCIPVPEKLNQGLTTALYAVKFTPTAVKNTAKRNSNVDEPVGVETSREGDRMAVLSP